METTAQKEDLNKSNTEAGTEQNQATINKQDSESAAAGEQTDASSKLKEELEASKEKYIRLYSEFENFRKRTAKEKLELIHSANEQLLKDLLPVTDDFERAENAFPDKNAKELAGFFLIHSKFRKVLELYGIKTMDTARGSEFNADLHEAISQLPAPSPDLKGKVVDVVEKGYMLNDKVIRYAKVVVGN
jgi:molecular chaperone GrpE